MTRSQVALVLGVFGKVVIVRSPSALNTSPNVVVGDRITVVNQEPQRAEAVTQVHGRRRLV